MTTIIYADDYASFTAALAATPAGGKLILETGDYRYNGTLVRDNITIQGIRRPKLAADNNSLEDGSIIKGSLTIQGNGVYVSDLGVDFGPTVSTTYYGGAEGNGLIFYGDSSVGIKKDVAAENVIGMCKSPSSPYHAFMANGINDFYGNHIEGIGGQHACVFKVIRSNVSNVVGRLSGYSGIFIKSDVLPLGSDSTTTNYSNLSILDINCSIPYGISIYAQSSNLVDVNISNITVVGSQNALSLVCDTRASLVNRLRRVNISNVNIYAPSALGLNVFGGISESSISSINVYSPASDKGIDVQSDCLGLRLTDALVSLRAANTNPADAVKLAGRVWANGVHCIQDGDYSIKRGIKDLREATYGSLTNVWGNVT